MPDQGNYIVAVNQGGRGPCKSALMKDTSAEAILPNQDDHQITDIMIYIYREREKRYATATDGKSRSAMRQA